MAEHFTEAEVVKALKDRRELFRSQSAMARAIGVTPPHLSRIMSGQKKPYGKVLAFLGLKSETAYVPDDGCAFCPVDGACRENPICPWPCKKLIPTRTGR